MANSCLVVLCGLPGAGKSFLANRIVEKFTLHSKQRLKLSDVHAVNVCYDKIIPDDLYRKSLEADSTEKGWKEWRKEILMMVEELVTSYAKENKNDFRNIEASAADEMRNENLLPCSSSFQNSEGRSTDKTRHLIIIDDNMFYTSMRYEYLQIARKYCTGFLQVYVSCKMDEVLQRNESRTQRVSTETIFRMNSKFEVPDGTKNEWEKNTVTMDTTSCGHEFSLDKVLNLIEDCFENPTQPLPSDNLVEKEQTRQINLKSILHQADNVVRKYISQEIKKLKGSSPSSDTLKALTAELRASKHSFLEELKNSPDVLVPLSTALEEEQHSELRPTVGRLALDSSSDTPKHLEIKPIDIKQDMRTFEIIVNTLFTNYREKGVLAFLKRS